VVGGASLVAKAAIGRRACIAGGLALPLLAAARLPGEPALEVEVLSLPEAVPTGGALIATYELTLSNMGTRPLRFERVNVLDERGHPILELDMGALAKRFAAPGPDHGPLVLDYGRIATVYLEVPLRDPPPAMLGHDIWYREAEGPLAALQPGMIELGTAPLPRLGPPLRDGPWIAVHAPEWPRGHRRVIYTVGRPRIPGRLAIDFVRVDANGQVARGDPDVAANAIGYGAEVLAVADGRVAAVRDGMAESPSVSGNPKHARDDAAGNFVSLDLGGGRFAIYEHLKPGSVRVKTGDRVRAGDTIAALGFSGDTTGPHLHFHVADAAMPLLGEGKGFVFAGFEQLGCYPDLGVLGAQPWSPTPRDGPRRGERPGSNSVVRF
jgi:hypothetical protein